MSQVCPSAYSCALVLVAEGFNEIEVVATLSALRQAGQRTWCVGLTGGAIRGAQGIWLKPDFKVAEQQHRLAVRISMAKAWLVVLPGEERSLVQLLADPQVQGLLREVAARGGLIATCDQGREMLRALLPELETADLQLVVWSKATQPFIAFAEDLVRRVVQPVRRRRS